MTVKLTRIIVCCIAGMLLAGGARPAAAQAIPTPLLAELKAATVYVKVNRHRLQWSGSGFVIRNVKGAALIVTNAHVLEPPKIQNADIAKGISPARLKLILDLQREVSRVASNVSVVFYSGTPQEKMLPAEVIARDAMHDLAVLQVAAAPEGVKAIPFNTEQIPETTQLIGFGFPFGEMLLPAKTNPTITVTRVELTSYKATTEDMTLLQLQGPVNPGNSGGPVVDVHGKLCGVQDRTVFGSGLGYAIPTEQVVRMIRGRLMTWRMVAKKDAAGSYDVEYGVQLIDPLQKIGELQLHYLTRAAALVSPAEFTSSPTPLSGAKTVELKRDGQWAVGTFKVAHSGPGPLVITVQPSWIDGSKKSRLGQPEVVRIRVNADAPASLDDGRTFWHYADKTGEGCFVQTVAGWEERDAGGSQHLVEIGRTPDLIELLDVKRGIRFHLHHDQLATRSADQKQWTILHYGGWEAAGVVAAPK